MTGKNGKIGKGENEWTIIFLYTFFPKERMNERKEERKLVEK